MNKMLSKALCWPQTPLHPFHVGFLTELQFSFFSHTANIYQSQITRTLLWLLENI